MALPATTVWECRSDGGNINNGAGFDSTYVGIGTDYSQQANSQYDATDLASSNGTNATPTVTSASHTFVTADTGNLIRISAGASWTVGWYLIASVSGGGAVLDRACGSADSLSSGTYRVGGACPLTTTSSDAILEAAVPIDSTVYIKAGTYSPGAIALSGDASVATAKIIGYNSTRGDSPTGTDRPLLAMGANAFGSAGNNTKWMNIRGTSTNAGGFSFTSNVVLNCAFQNTSTGIAVGCVGTTIFNSSIISDGGIALNISTGDSKAYGCYINGDTVGVDLNATDSNLIQYSIVIGGSTGAIFMDDASTFHNISNNILYGAETPVGVGITIGAAAATSIRQIIVNNIIYGFTTGISTGAAMNINYIDYNNFFNNTTNRTNVAVGDHDISVDPEFVDAAGGDFTIEADLPGFPGTLQTGGTGYLQMGAVQKAVSSGPGTAKLTIHPSSTLTL